MTPFFQGLGLPYEWAWTISTICGILLIALPVMLSVAMVIYVDRKVWAAMALRRGPNVVGPFGLLQPVADGVKLLCKETILPTGANKFLFLFSPILAFFLALSLFGIPLCLLLLKKREFFF